MLCTALWQDRFHHSSIWCCINETTYQSQVSHPSEPSYWYEPTSQWGQRPAVGLDGLMKARRIAYFSGRNACRSAAATEVFIMLKTPDITPHTRHIKLTLDKLVLVPALTSLHQASIEATICRSYILVVRHGNTPTEVQSRTYNQLRHNEKDNVKHFSHRVTKHLWCESPMSH